MLFAASSGVSLAATAMAPSAVLTSAATLDGKPATATGTIKQYEVHKTLMGTFTSFGLCDTKCVAVVENKDAGLGNGQTTTVSGTFHVSYTLHGKQISNVITVGL
jgi:hypothetical protein